MYEFSRSGRKLQMILIEDNLHSKCKIQNGNNAKTLAKTMILTVVTFQQRYAHNPLSLYQTVQQCLSSEMHLVQRSEGVRNSL